MTQSHDKGFFKLPIELRKMIYKLALPQYPSKRPLEVVGGPPHLLAVIPNIAQTCQIIRKETLRIWLGQNTFRIFCPGYVDVGPFKTWFKALGPYAAFFKNIDCHVMFRRGKNQTRGGFSFYTITMKRHRGERSIQPLLEGVGKGLFRSVYTSNELTRPFDHFRSTSKTHDEAMETIDRIAYRVSPHHPTISPIKTVLKHIIKTTTDFDGGDQVYLNITGSAWL